ncbi:MAG: SDR family NAD(P)-dependent oxidoreductase [Anaerolineales bacterium]|nr:SDR family NAD(P)-dependent oxidoreductase [Anaerolineales bacterium]
MPTPVMLISGASSGIGAATARLCAQAGYRLVLAARREEHLAALATEIRAAGGEALVVPADVTVLEDIQNLVQTALATYGQIDVLLNNAGLGRLKWLEDLAPQGEIETQLDVNLTGAIWLTGVVLPHMIARRSGHIIQMASLASWIATPTYSVYAASKFGLRGFSEALRREVSPYGIRVSSIYPGGVATEFAAKARSERKSGIGTPDFLRLSADDVAKAVLRVLKRPRPGLIIPGVMRLAVVCNLLFPGLVDWIIEHRFTRLEREL